MGTEALRGAVRVEVTQHVGGEEGQEPRPPASRPRTLFGQKRNSYSLPRPVHAYPKRISPQRCLSASPLSEPWNSTEERNYS